MHDRYAAREIEKLTERGPSAGEDFYRLKMTGTGETRWVNVTPAQADAIRDVLEPERAEAGAMSTSDGIGAADDDHEIYDVEIVGPDDDPLGIIHGIAAASPEAACDAPQVGQYLEQIREERPDATVGRVTRS